MARFGFGFGIRLNRRPPQTQPPTPAAWADTKTWNDNASWSDAA